MSIKRAEIADINIIKKIVTETISKVYPRYYPVGAVDFFLAHHSKENISKDIKTGRVFLCENKLGELVGTVTIKNNEICRLFVLPNYQGQGYGKELLDYAENMIFNRYTKIQIDASLPAKKIYIKRGYVDIQYNMIETDNGDFLCYDVMVKH